ncbi:hypothetical protein NDU88_010950 [Pleurodeles waltl]|uniref:Anti-proliferative protein domain-containing protein n=1 Tax=Pleurodeles waltl TaxID=8319 RepID=A0AAV7Q3D8_PLEWA|nr:hypothetical protein NDU88_010950 [Pleurodeles waltl]
MPSVFLASTVPPDMRAEIEAGVSLILKLINRRRKFHPRRVERFGEVLNSLLLLKYDGHWYPDDPTRGQAYRCIRINPWQYVDESVLKACAQSGLVYSKMPFPVEITLWIDPYEVSCRLAENKASFLVAKFCRPLNYFKNLASREPETSDYHSEASSENPSESSDDEVFEHVAIILRAVMVRERARSDEEALAYLV